MTGLLTVAYAALIGAVLGPVVILSLTAWLATERFNRRYRAHTRRAYITTLPRYVYDCVDWSVAKYRVPQAAVVGALVVAALRIFVIGLFEVVT